MTMAIVYGVLFAAVTGTHLLAGRRIPASLRAPTKAVIVYSVLGMYLEWMHARGAVPSGLMAGALITSWLGDLVLIPKGDGWFAAGGITFGVSHILFILVYAESGIDFSALSPLWIALFPALYAGAVGAIFFRLRPHVTPRVLFVPMLLYLTANGTMNCFAWFRLLSGSCSAAAGLTAVMGAVLFFISDTLLFFKRFDKSCPVRTHVPVMLTYSLGEFLITLGLMLQVP